MMASVFCNQRSAWLISLASHLGLFVLLWFTATLPVSRPHGKAVTIRWFHLAGPQALNTGPAAPATPIATASLSSTPPAQTTASKKSTPQIEQTTKQAKPDIEGSAGDGTKTLSLAGSEEQALSGSAGRSSGLGVGDSSVLAAIRSRIEARKYYPFMAQKKGWEGEVGVEFCVGQDGHIVSSAVVRGTTFEILNAAALETLKRSEPLPYYPHPITMTLKFAMQ